jgi:hypothetical protein
VGLCELTLRLTQLRLPLALRLPMHLFFALFFLYPIGLDYCLYTLGDQYSAAGLRATLLGVLLFPAAAAAITLSLLPAALRGPGLIPRQATPWTWPCYPWSLYVLFGVAVVFRAFYLTISFHPRAGTDSAFAPYFLTPFAVAVAAVVFEIGRSVRNPPTQHLAMAVPLLWIPFALTGRAPCAPAGDFLCLHLETFGSPLQVTCGLLLALSTYGWLRGGPAWLPSEVIGLTCLAAVVGPHTVDLQHFGPVNWRPLAVAAGLCLVGAWRQPQQSVRWFATASLALLSVTVAGWETSLLSYRGALPIHLWLVSVAVIGYLGRDEWAKFLRSVTSVGVVALAFGVMVYSARSWHGLSPGMAWGYVCTLTAVAWLLWTLHRSTDHLATATLASIAAAAQSFFTTSALLRASDNPRGWALVLAGAACFAIGMAVSACKMRGKVAVTS